jgi:hypothetical protein
VTSNLPSIDNPGSSCWACPCKLKKKKTEMKMEWIKVTERLPEDDVDVLVYHEHDCHITVGCFESKKVSSYVKSDGSIFFVDSGWYSQIPWAPKGDVTHWMPLPPPPQVKNDQS